MDKISRETFFLWIETAEADGYILDHNQGILPSISSLNFNAYQDGEI
jgi:hypothetical protein